MPLFFRTLLRVFFAITLITALGSGAEEPSANLFKQQAIAWSQQPLAEGLAELSRTTKVPIWLDRRVDPSTLIEIQVADATFRIVESIAESVQLRAVVVPSLIVVAQPENADRIASSIMATRAMVNANRDFSGLSQSIEFKWPFLAQPQQIALLLFQKWNVKVDRQLLPHDLWRETRFERVDGATVLALLGSGFELAPVIRGNQFTWTELPTRIVVSKRYTNLKEAENLESLVREADPQSIWKVDRKGWVDLTGTAAAHQVVMLSLAKPINGSLDLVHRYKLNVINKPAKEVLLALAANEKWEIDWSQETASAAETKVVNLQREATCETLFADVCQQAGLTWKRTDRQVRIERTE